jgi:hypothetical protein
VCVYVLIGGLADHPHFGQGVALVWGWFSHPYGP